MIDSKELEEILLGKIFEKKSLYYDHHNSLSEDLFKDPLNRKIFANFKRVLDKGEALDVISAIDGIKDPEAMTRVAEAMSMAGHRYLPENVIGLLSEMTHKASLKSVLDRAERDLSNEKPLDDILSSLEKGIEDISKEGGDSLPDIKSQVKRLHEELDVRMSSDDILGTPSGFASIDKFTGGWQETDLIILGGDSSMGKTSLGAAFCLNSAKAGIPAAIFSYEMGDIQILQRLVSLESEVNNRYIMKGNLNDQELKRVHRAMGAFEKMPLFIDETSNSSLRYLINKIRQYSITKGVKLYLVDYLQLVSNPTASREQEVASVARALKNVAKELGITIVALSQLSRSVRQNPGCRPNMSNLRESGEIEQAADIVMFTYRPEYYGILQDEDGSSTEGLADLIIAKGRNIGIGTIPMNFKPEFTKFTDRDTYENYKTYTKPDEEIDYESAF